MIQSHPHDGLLDELRRANPVSAAALASPTDPQPARLLASILADTEDASPRFRDAAVQRAFGAAVRRRWIAAAAAAAAIVVAAAATIVVYDTGTGRDATAAVHHAVETTLAVSDEAASATTLTFDFDVLSAPWETTIESVFSGGNFEYRLTSGPAVPEMGIPELGTYAEVVVDGRAYRSESGGPWTGPDPYLMVSASPDSGAPFRSNLSFGVGFDDLGGLYDFVEIGEADLDGSAAVHYRTQATPAGAGAGFLLTLGMFIMMTGQAPPEQLDSIQLDVWVDTDGLIRRVSYVADIDGIGAFTVVTDWDNFGNAPPITAPVN